MLAIPCALTASCSMYEFGSALWCRRMSSGPCKGLLWWEDLYFSSNCGGEAQDYCRFRWLIMLAISRCFHCYTSCVWTWLSAMIQCVCSLDCGGSLDLIGLFHQGEQERLKPYALLVQTDQQVIDVVVVYLVIGHFWYQISKRGLVWGGPGWCLLRSDFVCSLPLHWVAAWWR